MKAKTISGDIITVIPKQYDGYVGYIEPATGYHYDAENLTIVSFDDDFKPDYWTRLEHQYAGMFLQAQISYGEQEGLNTEEMVEDAMIYAHALVEKLKSESNG